MQSMNNKFLIIFLFFFNLELSAVRAGEYYNLRIPIAAEAKSGSNWAAVH